MKAKRCAIRGMAACVLVTAAATAQVREKEQAGWAYTGKLVSLDPSAKLVQLQVASGTGRTFVVNDKTTRMSGSRKIAFGDLTKGNRVVANGDSSAAGNVATCVEVVDP